MLDLGEWMLRIASGFLRCLHADLVLHLASGFLMRLQADLDVLRSCLH